MYGGFETIAEKIGRGEMLTARQLAPAEASDTASLLAFRRATAARSTKCRCRPHERLAFRAVAKSQCSRTGADVCNEWRVVDPQQLERSFHD
jgi:hypothetical protein